MQDDTSDPRGDPRLSLDAARRIDRICERFERSLSAEPPATIEGFLSASPAELPVERAALLRELLAIELEHRWRRGERPALEEYRRRFAADGPLVEWVFRESADGVPEATPAFLLDHPRYRVVRLLGSGGMGAVYLAEHRVLERLVALKIIRQDLLAAPGMAERFHREAKAAARLSHPNIVAVYDAESVGDRHFLVMEYVEGADLARVVRDHGPLPADAACGAVRQAAIGLEHAHRHGMVHRDISPRNLILAADGRVKILDFGLARFVSEAQKTFDRRDAPGFLLGSIDYMAPEQAADPQAADIRADVYSLGCTLYFLLAGRPPFGGRTLAEKLEAHAAQSPPELAGAGVPPELLRVLARMLSKSPAARHATPQEAADALAPWAGDPALPSPAQNRDVRPNRGRRWIVAGAAALACGLALAAWHIGRSSFDGRAADTGEATAGPSEAQRLYREGLLLLGQRREPQMRLAIERLQEAARLSPDFAPAHAALADGYNLSGDYGFERADVVFPKAKEAAQKALALKPDLAEAHLALAFALDAYDGDAARAEKEYLLALKLKPKLPAAHHWYAWFLVQQGRPKEAAREMAEAQRHGPDDVVIANNAGKIHYLCRDYPQAVKSYLHAVELNPDFRKAHRDLGYVYAEMGRLDDALREIDRAAGLTEDDRDRMAASAYAFARNGHAQRARELLAQLEPLADGKPLAYEIAAVYAALGEPDRALAWLGRAFQERSAARAGVAVDPRFDGVRADPRFKSFVPAGTKAPPAGKTQGGRSP